MSNHRNKEVVKILKDAMNETLSSYEGITSMEGLVRESIKRSSNKAEAVAVTVEKVAGVVAELRLP